MEKFLERISLCGCVLALVIALSSCGEDEPNESDDLFEPEIPENNQENDNTQSEESMSGNYVLYSAVEKTIYASGGAITMQQFCNPEYEVNPWSGRTVLKSYDKYNDCPYCTFTYNLPNSVCFESSTNKMNCTLNIKGLISTAETHWESYDFEYDAKNRLTSATIKVASEIHEKKYSYDNLYNIIGYKRILNGEVINETKVEYTTILAKTIPLQLLAGNEMWLLFEVPFMEMGLYGNSIPLYLIDRIVTKSSTGEEIETVYEYKLNSNGYVEEMTAMDYRASQTFISKWEFEWLEVSTPSYTNWLFSDITSPYYRYIK